MAWWEFAVLRVPIQHPFTTAHFGNAAGQIKLHVLFVVDWYQPPLQKPASTPYVSSKIIVLFALKISIIQGKDCQMFEMNSVNTTYYNCHNLIIYLPNNFKIIIKCPWVKKMDLSVWKPGLHPLLKKFYNILQAKKTGLIVYDLYVDARGIYLILGVQEGAFKKKKH